MMNDPFSHEPPKPFHSSVYARVSRGNTLGSTSAQTFGQRANMERTRSSVRRYGDSHIGLGYIHRSSTPGAGATNHTRREGPTIPPRPSSGAQPQVQRSAQSFSEPPARYNPYQ